MTLEELAEQIDKIRSGPMWRPSKDANVVVLLSMPSVGPRRSSAVEGMSLGIDWDKGSFFLKTADPLVLKQK